jgi:hypothetical protein
LDASYKNYWAFRNPLWAKIAALPTGALYSLDSLMPRHDFAKTDIFNEWWKPADYSLAMLGANLQTEDQLSSILCVVNAPGNDTLTNEQTRLLQAAARHIARAARIHRQLWTLDHLNGSTPERFEGLRQGAILVDAAANVLFINSAARAILETGGGLILKGGCLATTDGTDALQRLIASCAHRIGPLRGPLGGELEVQRGPHRAGLRLVVTPLRSRNRAAEIPWLGLRAPVAIVTMADPEISRQWLAQDLNERFGLTVAVRGWPPRSSKAMAARRRRGDAGFRSRRPARNSPAFLKRPERTARPNLSISCSNSPTRETRKNGRFDCFASIRGHLRDYGL